jgi:type II secretory pathway predicted ATPase ExeA
MSFMLRQGWFCQFLEQDLKTSLPRKVTLDDAQKLIEMAERGGCTLNLEARQAMNHAIEIGRGGVWLELTEEQYQKLRAGGLKKGPLR